MTPTDVHLNRALRGPDWNRIQGRLRSPPAGPSRSLPAPTPCFALVIDQHHSKFPDIFGNTCTIHIACENSGAFWVESAKSGKAVHLYDAMLRFIHAECNAYGHRVHSLHADADSVFNKLVAPFGAIGILVSLAPPGHHAVRVERHTQTFHERRRMLEASLSFTIPEKFGLATFMDKHVAYSMRNLVNSSGGYLNTPDEIVKRMRNPISPRKCCPFYSVVAVRMGQVKRAALAAKLMVHIQRIPFSELAVCLGSSDGATRDAHYFFVYSTMKVVLRRNFKLLGAIIPDFCTPRVKNVYSLDPGVQMTSPVRSTSNDQLQLVQQGGDCMRPISLDTHGSNVDLMEEPVVTAVSSPVPVNVPPPVPVPVVSPVPVVPPVHAPVVPPVSVVQSPSVSSPEAVPRPPLVTAVVPCDLSVQHVEPAPSSAPVRPVVAAPEKFVPVVVSPCSGPSVAEVSSPVVPPLPVQRASTRQGRGVNRHLHFDNSPSPSPSQHQRKVALIAARARARHVMCDATWVDICSAAGPIAPPPSVVARTFVSVPSLPPGTPQRAALIAGARRVPHRPVLSPPATFIRPLLRHLCFLSMMQHALLDMPRVVPDVLECPDLSAFVVSPLVAVEPVSPPLAFADKDNKEMSYRKGVKVMPLDEVRAAVLNEITKLFDTHRALRAIAPSDIRPDAVRIYSSMLLKTKYFADGTYDRVAARLAANGKDQPEGSFDETYAPTADESSTLCAFSSFIAHSVQQAYAEEIQC